jgi:hypothetical protein
MELLHHSTTQTQLIKLFFRGPLARVHEDANIEQHTRLRAEAAVLFVEGYYAEAAARAEAALGAVADSADRGGSLAEAELLQDLLVECRQRIVSVIGSSQAEKIGG